MANERAIDIVNSANVPKYETIIIIRIVPNIVSWIILRD